MSIFRIVLLVFLLTQTEAVLASDCGKPISVDAVAKLSGTITLGDLKTKLGEWCQRHGPVSWYRETSGMEIWFWWRLPEKSEAEIDAKFDSMSDAEIMAEVMKYRVLVATKVPAANENVQQIIWPEEFVGKNICDIFEKNGMPCRK